MEQILTIDGKKVKFKSTAAFSKRYSAQFQRNIFSDFFKMGEAVTTNEEGKENIDFEKLDFNVFYDIAWSLAKTADNTIPPVEDWLDEFEEFPIETLMPKLMDMVSKSISSSRTSAAATKKK